MLFAQDERCEVHQSILPIREEKDGWIHHFAPGGVCCTDDGNLFSSLVSKLLNVHILTCTDTHVCTHTHTHICRQACIQTHTHIHME